MDGQVLSLPASGWPNSMTSRRWGRILTAEPRCLPNSRFQRSDVDADQLDFEGEVIPSSTALSEQ